LFGQARFLTTVTDSGKPFVIKGSGRPLRQFVFSEDLARLMVWSLREYNETAPLILSVDEEDEVSISDVAALIVKHMGFEGTIEVRFPCLLDELTTLLL
jgi:nucleoside-diphosphate-sugar epimerase